MSHFNIYYIFNNFYCLIINITHLLSVLAYFFCVILNANYLVSKIYVFPYIFKTRLCLLFWNLGTKRKKISRICNLKLFLKYLVFSKRSKYIPFIFYIPFNTTDIEDLRKWRMYDFHLHHEICNCLKIKATRPTVWDISWYLWNRLDIYYFGNDVMAL